MTTLDGLIAAAQAERARLGRDAPVYGHIEDDGSLALTTQADASDQRRRRKVPQAARDAMWTGLALPVSAEGLRHGLYLAQRSMGDAQALRSGRLPQRLGRRWLTRNVWGRAMRRLG